ncbi:molybdopterin-binding oxidoreductase [Aeromonas veronii]|uniref:molybdopterin-binding oxidoreductase n=1 Tax=Aeromonas veronii TaxID=654 RepID=UPI00214DE8C7|nr:molybdopterin-binding oxidoreductase [Aeromonas veronii]MCR3972760.1 molybdopterin-binding oxidoreductase [Aeromonas veronii]MCR3977021.1 molybdopterin-binding oxidoreductase [Aeromonas veronii]
MDGWFGRMLLLSSCLVSGMAWADDAFLKIKGDGCCNGKGEVVLSRADFEALPQTKVTTRTPWTKGEHTYSGVLLRDLLKIYDLKNTEVKAVAVNDYWAAVPLEDGSKYSVLLADKQDSKELTLRNKGPLWIIYPLTEHPELDKELYHSRMVWQLTAIESK